MLRVLIVWLGHQTLQSQTVDLVPQVHDQPHPVRLLLTAAATRTLLTAILPTDLIPHYPQLPSPPYPELPPPAMPSRHKPLTRPALKKSYVVKVSDADLETAMHNPELLEDMTSAQLRYIVKAYNKKMGPKDVMIRRIKEHWDEDSDSSGDSEAASSAASSDSENENTPDSGEDNTDDESDESAQEDTGDAGGVLEQLDDAGPGAGDTVQAQAAGAAQAGISQGEINRGPAGDPQTPAGDSNAADQNGGRSTAPGTSPTGQGLNKAHALAALLAMFVAWDKGGLVILCITGIVVAALGAAAWYARCMLRHHQAELETRAELEALRRVVAQRQVTTATKTTRPSLTDRATPRGCLGKRTPATKTRPAKEKKEKKEKKRSKEETPARGETRRSRAELDDHQTQTRKNDKKLERENQKLRKELEQLRTPTRSLLDEDPYDPYDLLEMGVPAHQGARHAGTTSNRDDHPLPVSSATPPYTHAATPHYTHATAPAHAAPQYAHTTAHSPHVSHGLSPLHMHGLTDARVMELKRQYDAFKMTKYKTTSTGRRSLLSSYLVNKADEKGVLVQRDPEDPPPNPTAEDEVRTELFLRDIFGHIEDEAASTAIRMKIKDARLTHQASPTHALSHAIHEYRATHESSDGYMAALHAIPAQKPTDNAPAYFKKYQTVLDDNSVEVIPHGVVNLFKSKTCGHLRSQLSSAEMSAKIAMKKVTWTMCGTIAGECKTSKQWNADPKQQHEWANDAWGKDRGGQGSGKGYYNQNQNQNYNRDKTQKGTGKGKGKPSFCGRCGSHEHATQNCSLPSTVECAYCKKQGLDRYTGHLAHVCFRQWNNEVKTAQKTHTDHGSMYFAHGDDDDYWGASTLDAHLAVETDSELDCYLSQHTAVDRDPVEAAATAHELRASDPEGIADADPEGAARILRGEDPLPLPSPKGPRKTTKAAQDSCDMYVDHAGLDFAHHTCECSPHTDEAPELRTKQCDDEAQPDVSTQDGAVAQPDGCHWWGWAAICLLPLYALLSFLLCLLLKPVRYAKDTWRKAVHKLAELKHTCNCKSSKRLFGFLLLVYAVHCAGTGVRATSTAVGCELTTRWRTRYTVETSGAGRMTGLHATLELQPANHTAANTTTTTHNATDHAHAACGDTHDGAEQDSLGEVTSVWKLDTGATRSVLASEELRALGQSFPSHVVFSGFAGAKTVASEATVLLPSRFSPGGKIGALRCEHIRSANANLLSPFDLLELDPCAELSLRGTLEVFGVPLQILRGRQYLVRLSHPGPDQVHNCSWAHSAHDEACETADDPELQQDQPPAARDRCVGMEEHLNSCHTKPLRHGLFCAHCAQTKITACPRGTALELSPEVTDAKDFGEALHVDVMGPLRESASGHKYILHICDHATRWGEAIPLRNLTHASKGLEMWIKLHGRPATIHHDMARYFTGGPWATLCLQQGIRMRFSTPYVHRLNGRIERRHRTLCGHMRAALSSSGGKNAPLPSADWHLLAPYANYCLNRAPHSALGRKSPYEAKYGKKSIAKLLRWGCAVLAFNDHQREGDKLLTGHKGKPGRLVGVDPFSHSYLVALEGGSLIKTRVAHALKDEEPGFAGASAFMAGAESAAAAVEAEAEVRDRPVREAEATGLHDMSAGKHADLKPLTPEDLKHLEPEDADIVDRWRKATTKEIDRHLKHEVFTPCTWEEARDGSNNSIMSCRTLSNVKRTGGFKCRIVCSGHNDKLRIPSYAACLGFTTLRAALALISQVSGHIISFDVNSAFLQAPYKATCFARLDPALAARVGSKYARVNRCLNGLVHSPRFWTEYRDSKLEELGYTPIVPGLFCKGTTLVLCYVDDFLCWGPNRQDCLAEVERISNCMESEIVGELDPTNPAHCIDFLGVNIRGGAAGLSLDMEQYAAKCVSTFDEVVATARGGAPAVPRKAPTHTPLDPEGQRSLNAQTAGTPAVSDADKATRALGVRQKLGGLAQYLCVACRPDIAAAVNIMACCVQEAINIPYAKLFRYLRAPKRLLFPREARTPGGAPKITLECFSDADLGASRSGKSRAGHVVFLCGCAISWRSHQIQSIALSTCESELSACTEAVRQTEQLSALVQGLKASWRALDPYQLEQSWVTHAKYSHDATCNEDETTDAGHFIPLVRVDNESLLYLAEGSKELGLGRIRHLRLKSAYLHEVTRERRVQLKWIMSADNTADIFTKSLSSTLFGKHAAAMGVYDPHRPVGARA
jgi:hypothetical protein